ncbi:MAG TPA: hypothetical protein VK427_04000 [Kofleriaceae bacterium]|nr:hypothetical protein [Kofleriaceae bacterium]
MLRIALLAISLGAVGCESGGDTDQSSTRSTSDFPANGSAMGSAASTVTRTPAQPVKQGTSDTSTNSGTYNTGRSTTQTNASTREQPGNPTP